MEKRRRKFSSEEKVSILRKHLLDGVAVSDLCDQHGLHPTVFYRWLKAFFDNGAAAFDKPQRDGAGRLEQQISRLKDKLVQKNEVLSELMEEHVKLKKSLGEI